MNRRDFLKYSAMMAVAAASPALVACDDGSPYYAKPHPLVLSGEKLLLTNGMVIDVVTGQIAKGDILLQNGRIVDVLYGHTDRIHDFKTSANFGRRSSNGCWESTKCGCPGCAEVPY